MASWAKWLWGGMGWAMLGPIGGIMGYALGSMAENTQGFHSSYKQHGGGVPTQAGDFGAAMLILFSAVMKADHELKKSELEFIKKFLIQQFNVNYAQDRMKLFKEILKQDYPLKDVCIHHVTEMRDMCPELATWNEHDLRASEPCTVRQ